jgi:hypothetical protein
MNSLCGYGYIEQFNVNSECRPDIILDLQLLAQARFTIDNDVKKSQDDNDDKSIYELLKYDENSQAFFNCL